MNIDGIVGDVEIHFGHGGVDPPPGLQDPSQFWLWLLLLPWLAITVVIVKRWNAIRRQSTQAQRERLTVMIAVYFFAVVFSVVMTPPATAVLVSYLFLVASWIGLWRVRRGLPASPPGHYTDPADGKTKWWDGQRWLE